MRLQRSDDVTAPALERPETRLVLAISLDGRLAPAEGGAAQLGGEGDRVALEQALVWADACLIGAGTLRSHHCTCVIRNQALVGQRLASGRSAQPVAVVVSRSPDFSSSWRFFQQPLHRWLIAPAPMDQGFDRWFPLADSWHQQLADLGSAGIQRLVLLGGAHLAANLLAADCVDGLRLTVVPRVLSGSNTWLPTGLSELPESLTAANTWRAEGAETLGEGEWLLRYRRLRTDAGSVEL